MRTTLHFTGLAALLLLAGANGCGGADEQTSSGNAGNAGTAGTGGTTGTGASAGSTTTEGGGGTGGTGGTTGGGGTAGGAACTNYDGQATAAEIALSPFADEEAEVLAIEASGAVVAPKHVYDRIVSDLALIRGQYPEVMDIGAMVSWAPDQLLMGFDGEGMAAVQGGTYTDWDCPNAYYGLLGKEVSSFVLLHFNHRFNVPLLGAEYAMLPHVQYAEPNGLIGDGNDLCVSIESETKYHYVFDAGFGDCPAGCISHYYWGFSTEGSPVTVTPLGEYDNSMGQPPAWLNALAECTKWL